MYNAGIRSTWYLNEKSIGVIPLFLIPVAVEASKCICSTNDCACILTVENASKSRAVNVSLFIILLFRVNWNASRYLNTNIASYILQI